jgi:hypothetical protein
MNLQFTKDGDKWVASFASAPAKQVIVQVIRAERGYFTVYAGIDGLTPVSIYNESLPGRKDILLNVEVPEFCKLVFESSSEILEAAYDLVEE